jgi:HK97 gp10 family phage protein
MRVVFNRVPEVTASVEERAIALAEETRKAIAEEARQNAPVGSSSEGDQHPGQLRDSIHIDGEKVVADAPEANFVEHGTVYMEAQPFFAPAVQHGKRIMNAGLRKIIG